MSMSLPAKNVIFYCDDCALLSSAISIFKATHPSIIIQTTSEIKDLIFKVRSGRPEMVLIYLHDRSERYVSVLKEIRKKVDFSSIEIVIYRTLPDVKELEKVFRKIGVH